MNQQVIEPLSVSIKQAVTITSLSRSTLYRMIDENIIKPRKSNGRTVILYKDLKAYIEGLPVS